MTPKIKRNCGVSDTSAKRFSISGFGVLAVCEDSPVRQNDLPDTLGTCL